jgi:V8-like Glu-specific endopeptidase
MNYLQILQKTVENIFGYKNIPTNRKREIRESTASALEESFTREFNSRDDKIEPNLVSIGNHSTSDFGSGLLLTTNGLILTAYHTIKEWEEDWTEIRKIGPTEDNIFGEFASRIEGYFASDHKKTYQMDPTFYVKDTEHDIAIVKAIMPNDPRGSGIRLSPNQLKENQRLWKYSNSYRTTKPERSHVVSNNYDINIGAEFTPDTFVILSESEAGDSGSPITNNNDDLVGVIIAGGKVSRHNFVYGTKSEYIRKLIEKAATELRKI